MRFFNLFSNHFADRSSQEKCESKLWAGAPCILTTINHYFNHYFLTTVQIGAHKRNVNPSFEPGLHPIDTISYGVQDLVYTRWVFLQRLLLRGLKCLLLQGFCNDCGKRRPGASRGRRNQTAPFWVSRLRLRLEADCSQTHICPRQCISGPIHLFFRLTKWPCDKIKIYQGWFSVIRAIPSENLIFRFVNKFAGFLKDNKVDPEEETDKVCNRPSQPRGNRAGPKKWTRHWVLSTFEVTAEKIFKSSLHLTGKAWSRSRRTSRMNWTQSTGNF